MYAIFFFKQKTAYEMRISDWSSDVCSSDLEDFEKIDRHGTWLKRPPFDYTPTAFDRFWVPNETLLQEWVRRSIKEVLIPIPGTSKSITCSVVLLALGGACAITDPNLQDVEAGARAPQGVPFKPQLHENQAQMGKSGRARGRANE